MQYSLNENSRLNHVSQERSIDDEYEAATKRH